MTKLTSNRYNLRILQPATQEKINSILKLKNGNTTINAVINECLEIGATFLLDNNSLVSETFGEKLEKNTRKITAKLNRIEQNINKSFYKTLALLMIQEGIQTTNLNLQLFNNEKNGFSISNEMLEAFGEMLPPSIADRKDNLLKSILDPGDNDE